MKNGMHRFGTWIVKLLPCLMAMTVVLVCLLALPTHAHAASESDLTLTLNRDGNSYSVTGCKTSASGELTIPAAYKGKPVNTIGTRAFSDCSSLTSVTIPDSVTSIGWEAFSDCSSLTSITIPGSVTYINSYAFSDCSSLSSITIMEGVTSIDFCAFSECSGLTSITIPDSVTRIDAHAFSGCSSLTSVTIPDSVTSIGYRAFYRCTSLTSITIPDSVTSISASAFSGCTGLINISIPDSVTFIGGSAFHNTGWFNAQPDGPVYVGKVLYKVNGTCPENVTIKPGTVSISSDAFYGCTTLESLTIPASINDVGKGEWVQEEGGDEWIWGGDVFTGCDNLKDVYISDWYAWRNSVYIYETNPDYNDDDECSDPTVIAEAVHILNLGLDPSVTTISADLFRNYSKLASVTIPDTVTTIEAGAFSGCSNLRSITIPFVGGSRKTARDTYQYPLGYLFGTTSYTGSTATTQRYYGSSTFSTTSTTYYIPTSLRSVTVTGGEVTYGAFYGCSGLTSVTLGNKVTKIEESAFYGCSSLESITIPFVGDSRKSAADTYQYPFGYIFGTSSYTGSTATKQYYYGTSTTSTTYDYYYIPTSLRSVNVTGGELTYGAFYGCSGLTSVTLGNEVTKIGESAFYDCSGLTTVNLPGSVTSIGPSAFYGCGNLTSIAIPSGVTVIADDTFHGCHSLTSVTIPDSVTSIRSSVFFDCSSLTAITIPDSVKTIGLSVFSGCSSLESMTIPFIGMSRSTAADTYQYPFGIIFGTSSYTGSTATTQRYYGFSTSSTTSSTYYIPTSLRSVTVTGGEVTYGAFYGCSKLTSVAISNGVTNIGGSAFYGCAGLTVITIPASVTSIGEGAFYGCGGLTGITIPFIGGSRKTSTDTYQYPFGFIFGTSSYTGGTATKQSYYGYSTTSTTSTTYYIPTSLKSVTVTGGELTYGAFYGCSNLTSVTLANGVSKVGGSAFHGCSGLTSIAIPGSVTDIGSSAFFGCSSLESMAIPFVGGSRKTATDIYQYPFGYIFGTDSYYGSAATTQCYCISNTPGNLYLTTATHYIPTSLKQVTVTGGEILRGAFENCNNLTSITIPDSVTSIGESAFKYCTSLTSITIPDSVTNIDGSAFEGCNSLANITIPDSVSSIGYSALHYTAWYNAQPDGLVYAGKVAYTYKGACPSEVTIKEGTLGIAGCAFYYCNDLTSITIPDSVTNIGDSAFCYCSNLAGITIPDSVTSISSSAFAHCTSLTSITIGTGVTTVDDWAFEDCSSVKAVFYRGTVQQKADIEIDNTNDALMSAAWHYEVEDAVFADQACYYCPDCNDYLLANGEFALATITFQREDGTVISTETCHYGGAVTIPQVSAEDGYAHRGWDKEVTVCQGNAVYTAVFELMGDVGGDGSTDNDDVMYLLWHVVFGGEEYPLTASGDTNGDGNTDSNDIIYLLWHLLFGKEAYPLH